MTARRANGGSIGDDAARQAPTAPSNGFGTFRWGVASGDVTASSVTLWTCVRSDDGRDCAVDWDVRTAIDAHSVRHGTAVATAERDHTVQIDVDDLDPGCEYDYTFTAGDESVNGRTRTLPLRANRLRFAVVCCSRWGWPGFERYGAVVDEDPDLVLHLGDSIYEIGEVPPSGVPTDPRWDCHSLADYRRRFRQHRSSPGSQRLLASVPLISIWDDHEVVDNAPDPGTADRRRAGQRAWREWTPMRQEHVDASIDRFLTVEGLMDLALVDARFSGRRPNDVDGPGGEGDGAGHLLAPHQWRLLDEFARSASSPWFVLANQVQVGPMTLAYRPAPAWPPWRRIVNPDQWDGYPDDRDRLYHLLRATAGTGVVLSGDLHSAWSRTLSDRRGEVAHEFTSPSISGTTYGDAVRQKLPIPGRALAAWLRTINGGIDHLDLMRHGFLMCDVTPERFTTTFVMHDGERHQISLSPD